MKLGNKRPYYNYSFWALNRGFLISLIFPLIICVWLYIVNVPLKYEASTILILFIVYLVFLLLHMLWDFRIRKNHLNIDVVDDSLVFYRQKKEPETVPICSIEKIEVFPSPDNISDSDYIENVMSSGIRFYYKGRKYIIFGKIRGFSEIQNILSANSKKT